MPIHRMKVPVTAKSHPLGGFRARAGQTDLWRWSNAVAPCLLRTVLNRGQEGPPGVGAREIQKSFKLPRQSPQMDGRLRLYDESDSQRHSLG